MRKCGGKHHTALHKERNGEKKTEDTADTTKIHLCQSERDPKDIYGNGSKWNQNSESSSSTGRRKHGHLLHPQLSTEASATYYITSMT